MTVPAVAQSVSPGIFMQGPGGLLAVPLCQRYGRYVARVIHPGGQRSAHNPAQQASGSLLVTAPLSHGHHRSNMRTGLR